MVVVRYRGVTWRREIADVGALTRKVVTLSGQDLAPRELNFEVNWVYHDISEKLGEILGPEQNANWATFGKWASRQVGTTLDPRGVSDAPSDLETTVTQAVVTSKGIGARLLGLSLAEVNRGIFWEVGYALARFADEFGDGVDPTEERFLSCVADIRRQPKPPGKLWQTMGDDALLGGLRAYFDALNEADDPQRKAQLIFLGNLLITDYEQRRIQPYMELSALSGIYGLKRASIRWLTPAVISRVPFLHSRYQQLRKIRDDPHPWADGWGPLELMASRATTWFLGTWVMGRGDEREILKMSRDVPPPRGKTDLYPRDLALIEIDRAEKMLADYEGAEGTGTAVSHWVDLRQRMRFTAAVFRSRQQEGYLWAEPYSERPLTRQGRFGPPTPCDEFLDPVPCGDGSEPVEAATSILPSNHVNFGYGEEADLIAELDSVPPFQDELRRMLITACRGGILDQVRGSLLLEESHFPQSWTSHEMEKLRGLHVVDAGDDSGASGYVADELIVDETLDPVLRVLINPDGPVRDEEPIYARFRQVCANEGGEFDEVWEVLAGADLPAWFDVARAEAGQRFYRAHRPQLTMGLLFASLPTSYASTKGVQVLYRISTLGDDPYRRIMYTASAMESWMTCPFWRDDSNAHRELDNVRVLHGLVRVYARPNVLTPEDLEAAGDPVSDLRTEGDQPWRLSWGSPVNQEDLLGTVLAFAVASVEGARRLNAGFSTEELDEWIHAWCGVGVLMGVRPDLLVAPPAALRAAGEDPATIRSLNFEEARILALQIGARQFGPSQAGAYLGSLLLDELEWVTPGPASVVRALLRVASSDFIADCVAIPPGGMTERLVRGISGRRDWLKAGSMLNRFADQLVRWNIEYEMATYMSMGEPPVWLTKTSR